MKKIIKLSFFIMYLSLFLTNTVFAADVDEGAASTIPWNIDFSVSNNGGSLTSTLQIVLILTFITLAPSILLMVTAFTRIVIVLHFTRSALGTMTTPPNQVLIGLALFLTVFVMTPTVDKINKEAIIPLNKKEITDEEAFNRGVKCLKDFMLKQTNKKDLKLFLDISKTKVNKIDDLSINVVIPSFIISELRAAFIMGFLIYIPFIIIDMVVASTLMSMGMMMLPPTTISMPFKILLFILADGWNLIITNLIKTFN